MREGRVFRALVVDDERAARDTLHALLAEEPRVAVIGEARNGDEAIQQVRALRPDLLLLDVQMPDRDGFGVLDALGDDVPAGIVFVTAHDEHALRAFEVHALDYVLKPFGRPRLRAAVRRAVRRLDAEDAWSLRHTLAALVRGHRATVEDDPVEAGAVATQITRLAVRRNHRTLLIDVDDVDWIEAVGDYVRLHTTRGVHLLADRMHALEQRLDAARFLRIHRSTIVNLGRVRAMQRADDGGGLVHLENGVQLRVARNRWASLEKTLLPD
ncbi:MAG: LytR/AlgR family response regulator transcription factor [Longimicrobiales bacterium]